MADKKITQLTNITGANLVDADEFVVVDISADETKAITLGELKEAFDSGSGFVRITGDTMTGNLSFGDNDKAIFGAGSDLQIYHDGSNSYIKDAGTGNLVIGADTFTYIGNPEGTTTAARFNAGGAQVFNHNNSQKLATTSTGIDVTGTVTADGLTVDGTSDLNGSITVGTTYTTELTGNDINLNRNNGGSYISQKGGGNLAFRTNDGSDRFRLNIDSNGDISFYEDTGTTPKFFWDASAESLNVGGSVNFNYDINAGDRGYGINSTGVAQVVMRGTEYRFQGVNASPMTFYTANTERMRIGRSGNVGIGTSSPSRPLEINSSSFQGSYLRIAGQTGNVIDANFAGIEFYNTDPSGKGPNVAAFIEARAADSVGSGGELVFATASTGATPEGERASEAMRIDSSGNVGIGITPSVPLHVNGRVRVDGGSNDLDIYHNGSVAYIETTGGSATPIGFANSGTERMRIDSSGNLLVGTTDASQAANTSGSGTVIGASGGLEVSRDSFSVAYFNKTSVADGNVIEIRKQGATVGSIGTLAGDIVIGTGAAALRFFDQGPAIQPRNADGTANNDAIDIGLNGNRFKNLFLSGGVYLGGTGAANKLDDYEEGTWTPVLNTGSFSSVNSTYTKIGSLVRITFDALISAGGGSIISGLPFTPADTTGFTPYFASQDLPSGCLGMAWAIGGGAPNIYVRSYKDNASFIQTGLSGGAHIHVDFTYRTTA